jgi:hypothetical protein
VAPVVAGSVSCGMQDPLGRSHTCPDAAPNSPSFNSNGLHYLPHTTLKRLFAP